MVDSHAAGEPRVVDFGTWVKRRLDHAGVSAAALSRESGIVYPSLARILNGDGGESVKPRRGTVRQIANALVRLGVIDEPEEAWVAAGNVVEGYRIVKDADSAAVGGLPPRITDLPGDLQEALAYILRIEPSKRAYMIKLWLEQADSHLKLQEERDALAREVAELERRRSEPEAGE